MQLSHAVKTTAASAVFLFLLPSFLFELPAGTWISIFLVVYCCCWHHGLMPHLLFSLKQPASKLDFYFFLVYCLTIVVGITAALLADFCFCFFLLFWLNNHKGKLDFFFLG